jgi:hypothetical protein
MTKPVTVTVVLLWSSLLFTTSFSQYVKTGSWTHVAGSTSPANASTNVYGVNLGEKFVAYPANNSSFGPIALSGSCLAMDSDNGLIYSFGGVPVFLSNWFTATFYANDVLWMFNTSDNTWTWLSGETVNGSLSTRFKGKYPSVTSITALPGYSPGGRTMCSLTVLNSSVYLYGGYGFAEQSKCAGKPFLSDIGSN